MRSRKHSNGVIPYARSKDLETFYTAVPKVKKRVCDVSYDVCLLSVVWQEPMGL
jgi:hypothetical protein